MTLLEIGTLLAKHGELTPEVSACLTEHSHQPSHDEMYERGKVVGIAVGLSRARSALDALRIPEIVLHDKSVRAAQIR